MSRFHYVTQDGGVWRISHRYYEALRKDLQNSQDIDLDAYGQYLGTPEPLAEIEREAK